MREIKFRAWNEENGMIFADFKFLMTSGSYFREALQDKQYELMQFTGLYAYNDKTQKWCEVYEYDILLKHGKYSVVEWDGVFLSRRLTTPVGDRNYLLQHHDLKEEDNRRLDGFRHCGNIYENPELLK